MRFMRPSRFTRIVLQVFASSIVIIGLATTSSGLPESAARNAILARASDVRLDGVQKRVLALYYVWYGTKEKSGKLTHYDGLNIAKKTASSHTHFPLLGAYDSTDPAVIDNHMQAAKAAGIDTLVCSWWGRDDPTDKAVRAVLARAPHNGITVCVMWERLACVRDLETTTAELTYLATQLGSQPGYLHEHGKPVVFLYERACQSLAIEDWAAVIDHVDRESTPGVLVIGGARTLTDTLVWDGLITVPSPVYIIGHSPQDAATVLAECSLVPCAVARRAGRISAVVVMPGWDDLKVNSANTNAYGTRVDRASGKLYTALWQEATSEAPDWIVVNSFNQWHNGTEIEPSVELGNEYLKLTANLANNFKNSKSK